jgi:hypothetical protein
MDRTKLKNYAPQARREFIQAMIDRAAFYGLTASKTEPVVEKGDVAVIGGRSFPIAVARKRKALEDRIKRHGFQQTMEAMAYTWFNRLVAIRYMELHGYLDHGYRVLSHPEGKPTPEILEHAEHVEFPGIKKDRVIDLKLAGNKEGELYRLLLTAQCNALHTAMPFLFAKIDDETELLLPDNLLNSDSLIRKLVNELDESDWQEVEIIGWLYQFYISERKDDVIGKVVASEDIPAATQLFTPNWIVKYLVQNTLGRQWLATYPDSPLRQQMEYYIEPAEQTMEVRSQLKAITPTSLNPEELTLLDPACGSGHILVEAYDLFKAIYQERGYRAKDIPALILQKNLFGLEIDDRAAQLAAFALMMKARADDRRIFDSEAKPKVVAIQESDGGQKQAEETAFALGAEPGSELNTAICELHALFENAKTFGSLIQVPPKLAAKLPEIEKQLDDVLRYGDLTSASANVLKPLLEQAYLLACKYDAVVANPPYMGSKFYVAKLKGFISRHHEDAKSDICTAFIERGIVFCKQLGFVGEITMQSWMFLSNFARLRENLLDNHTMHCMLHLGPHAFPQIGGQVVQVTSFVFMPHLISNFRGSYKRLVNGQSQEKKDRFLAAPVYGLRNSDFKKIPGCPIAYWTPSGILDAFASGKFLASIAIPTNGIQTGDNGRFVRLWHEVSREYLGKRWFPYAKGGTFRKWYGNCEHYVEWERDGHDIKAQPNCCIRGEEFYFTEGITWSDVTSGSLSCRLLPEGFLFDAAGPSAFCNRDDDKFIVLGLMNSKVGNYLAGLLNPTLHFQSGNFRQLPLVRFAVETVITIAKASVEISKCDWDLQETSWEFTRSPLLQNKTTLQQSQETAAIQCVERFSRIQQLEEQNNRVLIDAYGLKDELSPEVPEDQITLYRPNREEDIKRLISYAIGCMMGRYGLDNPGLIYAHSGNQGFDPSQYKTFRADDDGIIPLLETDWGIRDDATNRFVEFVGVAWPQEHLEENLKFVAESLGSNNGEQARETIRRYLSSGFYKHHLSMYKKRPIYWLFSSGKLRSFQCLVYLHRYNEGTLARIRTEYVIPLQGQIAARIDQLEDDKAKATSTSHRTKIQKEQDKLKKQQAELATFEEKLKHYADMRISLDLDDGVKVNYAKFGDLLAESKAITGGKDDE